MFLIKLFLLHSSQHRVPRMGSIVAMSSWLMWLSLNFVITAQGIGVNWGTLSSHRLSPAIVVNLLEANNISKLKLFDADPLLLQALTGTNIEVMVGIPNQMLKLLSKSRAAASSWVHDNITRYTFKGGVNIRYIAVGNEPFLISYKGEFQSFVLPAMINIQRALQKMSLESHVKVVVPCNADIYESKLPSKGIFRHDVNKTMLQLVSFLNKNGSPFVVNIYPFVSLYEDKKFPVDYAFFENSTHPLVDGRNVYHNDFDGNFDTLVAALAKIGFGQMPIIIGEIGWPTDGANSASVSNAERFNKGLINHILSRKGTPLRPGEPPLETYLFSLLDEDQKSVLPGNFERHWGMFTFDGQVKYNIDFRQGSKDLVNAENVQYMPSRWCVANDNHDLSNVSSHVRLACSIADCTALFSGGSCNNISAPGNVSYAFNSYYQLHNQSGESCYFDRLGMITTVDPSIGDCRFLVGISDSSASALYPYAREPFVVLLMLLFWTKTFSMI